MKGTPVSEMSLPSLEQPYDDGYHRGRFRMHKAPETETGRRTVRLADLEDKKQSHGDAPIFARGPTLADIAR
jgi:hypothetical protein